MRNNVVEIKQTCIACPEQWEGKIDNGQYLYIRYRHGHLTASVGDTIDDAVSWSDENSSGVLLHKEEFSGDPYLGYDRIRLILSKVISLPAHCENEANW